MGVGAAMFGSFWLLQSLGVGWFFGTGWALAYAISLPLSAAVALFMVRERRRVRENLRAFGSLLRKGNFRHMLEQRRLELEQDLALLARQYRRHRSTHGQPAALDSEPSGRVGIDSGAEDGQ